VAGARQNLVPGLVIQALALAMVLAYFCWPAARGAFDLVEGLKERGGFLYSSLSTALFGGAIPVALMVLLGTVRRDRLLSLAAFYILYWAWKGIEVDLLYRLQGYWFGNAHDFATIAKKVVMDQFIYNPLWATPTCVLCFLWKDRDFSWSGFRAGLNRELVTVSIPAVQVASWVVWVPMVAIIYCLPPSLQLPLFNLVLCFFVLMLTVVAQKASSKEATP
jgi:hypothetical protein